MPIRSHIVRNVLAGAAVLAALLMGPLALTGQAGAATTPTSTSANHAKSVVPAVCSGGKSRFKLGRLGKGMEKRALKLEAREAKAKAAGHTKRAAYLAKLIAHYEAAGSRLGKHHAKMEGLKSALAAKECSGSH